MTPLTKIVINTVMGVGAVILGALTLVENAKAEGYEYSEGYNTTLSADSQSISQSKSASVAVSPNNVNISQPNHSVTRIDSASAYAPSVLANPTAPCRVAIGGSGGWIAGSFGIGGSFEDEECSAREAYRMGIASPDADVRAAAKAVYFSLEAVKKTGVTPLQANATESMAAMTVELTPSVMSPPTREELCINGGGTMELSRYDGSPFCRHQGH